MNLAGCDGVPGVNDIFVKWVGGGRWLGKKGADGLDDLAARFVIPSKEGTQIVSKPGANTRRSNARLAGVNEKNGGKARRYWSRKRR